METIKITLKIKIALITSRFPPRSPKKQFFHPKTVKSKQNRGLDKLWPKLIKLSHSKKDITFEITEF